MGRNARSREACLFWVTRSMFRVVEQNASGDAAVFDFGGMLGAGMVAVGCYFLNNQQW